jgi:hypothetical protein
MAVVVLDTLAYIGSINDLQIVNVSDPTAPVYMGCCENTGSNNFKLSGDYLYACGGGLRVIDITDPELPEILGFWGPTPSCKDVSISGDFAFIAHGGEGLTVLNISDPTNLTWVGAYNTPVDALGVAVVENYVYLTDNYGGLRIIDVSIPGTPEEIWNSWWGSDLYGLTISGNYAYLANKYRSLRILDITTLSDPAEVCNYVAPPGGFVYDVDVGGDHAYVTAFDAGLLVVDISNPISPVQVGSYDLYNDGFVSVVLSGSVAFTIGAWEDDWLHGIFVPIDVSDPGDPMAMGSLWYNLFCTNLALSGQYAYVTFEDPYNPGSHIGLEILDISDPSAFFSVGNYWCGDAYGVAIKDNTAFVANGINGLLVLDVSDPSNPTFLCSYPTTGEASGVAVSGSYAIVADGPEGLLVLNISDPGNPFMVGYYDTPGFARNLVVSDDIAYINDGNYFGIYDCSAALPVEKEKVTFTPTTYTLMPPYPNPFNPTTMLSFQLPVGGMVKLEIFDVNGRNVGARHALPLLPAGWYSPGTHHILFDGSGLSSGIYLARLTAGDFSQVRKLVLMK